MRDGAGKTRLGPLLAAASLFSLPLLSEHALRLRARLGYDYDLNFWSEDFFFTAMMKLRAGQPLYGPVADANSSVYGPLQVWLHYALLAPFDAELSVRANKLLGFVALALASALGATLGARLLRGSGTHHRWTWAALWFALTLAALVNPLADGLHPCNLEALVIAGTALACLELPKMRDLQRRALVLALPGAALLLKQNLGVVCALSLLVSLIAWADRDRNARVADFGALALGGGASAGLAAALLGANYYQWGYALLATHGFEWQRVRGFASGVGPLFLPVAIAFVLCVVAAARRKDRAWLRAALPVLIFAPLALAAQLKVRGGSNNTASLGFALALLGLPSALRLATTRAKSLGLACAFGVQLLLWRTQKYVPNARDVELAEASCGFASARMKCGERVLFGRGALCHARGGVEVPADRMASLRDVSAAGRLQETRFMSDLAHAEYDVVLLHEADLRFFGETFWPKLNQHYKLFHAGKEQAGGDYWLHAFQGWGSRRVLYYERKAEAGRHSVSGQQSCQR